MVINQYTASKSTPEPQNASMKTVEVNRKGCKETAEPGSEFYAEIGTKQGKANNPGNFANWPKAVVLKAAKAGGLNSHRSSSAKE